MNLKEAFRFQNKLQKLMDEANAVLSVERNVVQVKNTALLSKVNPEAEDVVTVDIPDTEFAEQITEVAMLLVFLLDEKSRLSYAIRTAKQSMDIDFDGEVSLNAQRQTISGTFRKMSEIRSFERVIPNAGVGYKFNAEGNQISYRSDLKKVTTINFDRKKICAYATGLSKKADQISSELDKAMVNTEVSYDAPFDVNDSFDEILQWHIERTK